MIKLCTNCHEALHFTTPSKQWAGYQVGNHHFCKRACEIQFDKLSHEEQKAAHYHWVRQQALADSQQQLDLDS